MGNKVLALGLQTSLVTSYNQTATTLQGNIGQRTITDGNGPKVCLGPQPVIFGDVVDDTGAAPVGLMATTGNARVFVSKGFTAGVLLISYYLRTTASGVTSYAWQGDLKFTFTNTGVYTLRAMDIDDSNPAAMNFHFLTTNTTVVQGGWYAAFSINQTAFLKVSVATLPIATTGSQTGVVYQIGDQTTQAAQTVTVGDNNTNDATGGFLYILAGAAATPKFYKFVNTVPTATPTAGYSIANGAIAVTNVLPALAGTILLLNNMKITTSIGTWSSNTGFQCITFVTSTTKYNFKTSDITNGAATLPSLMAGNYSDGTNLSPTASAGQYSGTLDKFIILTTLGTIVVQQGINNDPNTKIFGASSYIKSIVGGNTTPPDFGSVSPLCLVSSNGFAYILSALAGQGGFYAIDLSADESSVQNINAANPGQINASIISPVISGNFSKGISLFSFYELAKRSVRPTIQYRTSNFSVGPGSGFDATWTTAPKDGDLSLLSLATQVQFRILFTIMGMEVTNAPQIIEAYFNYFDQISNSPNWVGSVDNTSQNGASPFEVSFRLQVAYASVVPKLFIRGTDDSGNVINFDTVTNIANMSYTTNNGGSYTPLGTIPNTALTTELKFNWTSPDGVRRRWSINES